MCMASMRESQGSDRSCQHTSRITCIAAPRVWHFSAFHCTLGSWEGGDRMIVGIMGGKAHMGGGAGHKTKPHTVRHGARDQIFQALSLFFCRGGAWDEAIHGLIKVQ